MENDVKLFLDSIKNNYFFVYDTETTGFNIESSDVIEISAIKVDGNTLEIIEEFDSLVNPGYHLPQEIIEFNEEHNTGITDEKIQAAPSGELVAKDFYTFIGKNPIMVGHNSISFDTKFVKKLFNKCNYEFNPYIQIDTLKLAKEKVPAPRNLASLYERTPDNGSIAFHSSIDDAKATLSVLKWLLTFYNTSDNHKESNKPITVLNLSRWTKTDTLDRIYIQNKENYKIFFDVKLGCFDLSGVQKKDVLNGLYLYFKQKDRIVTDEKSIISCLLEFAT